MSRHTRVLITGGAGFIGSHTADELIEQGCEVGILDSLVPQVHPSGTWPSWTNPKILARYQTDVRDLPAVLAALKEFQPHCIIHLAAEVGVGQAEVEMSRFVDANVRGTSVLLEAILLANDAVPTKTVEPGTPMLDGIRRLIVAGSMSSYGEGQWFCPTHGPVRVQRAANDLIAGRWHPRCPYETDDNVPCAVPLQMGQIPEWASQRPAGVYAMTKRDQEELATFVGNGRGLSVASARFFNVYGPRQAPTNPYTGVVVGFGARVRSGLAPRVYEDGHQARDFIHVSDVARALTVLVGSWQLPGAIRLWQTPAYQGPFNVGTGDATAILDVARWACQTLAGTVGLLEPEIAGQYRVGDIRACIADPGRLIDLKWQPTKAPLEGIGELYAAMASEPPPEADLEAAHRQLETAGLLYSAAEDESGDEAPALPTWGA
jgi:dTDP-L-rhamnose 4-epimerase